MAAALTELELAGWITDHPEGSTTEGIGGTSQSYGQDVKAGRAFPDGTPGPPAGPGIGPIDPSSQNEGQTDTPKPEPGYMCNGNDNPMHEPSADVRSARHVSSGPSEPLVTVTQQRRSSSLAGAPEGGRPRK